MHRHAVAVSAIWSQAHAHLDLVAMHCTELTFTCCVQFLMCCNLCVFLGSLVSTKVRVNVFVSSAESVFQRRVGRKSDDFQHCRSTVSYYFQRAYIHVAEYLIRVLIHL